MRFQLFVAGWYEAARAPEMTIMRRPVQTLSGCWLPASGARGSARQVLFAAL
jgi:hypothetical protein